jgi:hypothetical protein
MQTEHMRAFRGRQPKPRDALFPNQPEEWEVKGAARDENGIDWVPDPPETLRKWLLLFKMQNESKGIGLFQSLRQSGAKQNGLMQARLSTRGHHANRIRYHVSGVSCGKAEQRACGVSQKDQFMIALTSIYREWFFSPKLLKSICHAYGTGLDDPEGGKESVAWRDFCEDVDAQNMQQATWELDMLVRGRHTMLGDEFPPIQPTAPPSMYHVESQLEPAAMPESYVTGYPTDGSADDPWLLNPY